MLLILGKKDSQVAIAHPWTRTPGSAPLQIATVITRSAGGLVTRKTKQGNIEILIIHREHKNDWSLPKGKVKRKETSEQAAIREVYEETGFHCKTRDEEELTSFLYIDSSNRTKEIRYWKMEIEDESIMNPFQGNKEVDIIKWVSKEIALEMLTHERDRQLIRSHIP